MEPKEVAKLATAVIALVTLVLCFTLFKGHADLVAILVPGCVAAVAAVVVPSTGIQSLRRKDGSGKSVPPAALALLFLFLPLAGCGGSQRPPPEKVGLCLIKLYDRLN